LNLNRNILIAIRFRNTSPFRLRISIPSPSAILLLAGASLSLPSVAREDAKLSFNLDVRPILSDNCFHCHGQDADQREADLRLDTLDGATQDLGGYAALVPGDPEESELYLRITSAFEDEQMPPPDSNRALTDEQRETLRLWIEQGAAYEKHWAFVPPEKPEIDASKSNPIDHFIGERLQEEGLEFSPEAAPGTWLRRASFDLTGLPPTIEELNTFEEAVSQNGEEAYEEAVDRLLESPRFGERLAADWMDASRYADTHGFNNDSSRSMWRWRDWVIDAFNANIPYDQFIREQLAGDLLPDPSLDKLIATGFNRNHGINSEGGIIEEEYLVEYVADRVRTVSMVWLGLTAECARCHDHKYDPMTQEDYYRLFAFFNNVTEFGEDGRVANAAPMISSPTRKQQSQLESLETTLKGIDASQQRYLRGREVTNDTIQDAAKRVASLSDTIPEHVWHIGFTDKADAEILEFASSDDFLTSKGIIDNAFLSSADQSTGEIKADTIKLEKKTHAFTLAFWARPDENDSNDVPLLSNSSFEAEPSSSNYGYGWDIRLVDGEIEIAFSKRYPAYAAILRTKSVSLQPNEWRHVSVSFTGRIEEDNAYTPASRFRVHIDGEEVRTLVRHDGMQDFPSKMDRPTYIGFDKFPYGSRFIGSLDEIQQFDKALSQAEIRNLFEYQALIYLADKAGSLTSREQKWILSAALTQNSDTEWTRLQSIRDQTHAALLKLDREVPTTMIMQEREESRDAYILTRGQYDARGGKVGPGVPEDWIAPWPDNAPLNRLGLAQWLTQPSQPLTARVVVNRFWQQFFGVGLVKTSEDFGIQSEYPSHPELLDWLAVEFQESGWDVKALLKQIALSRAYRQDSTISPDMQLNDPENRLLARGPRLRLPAESIRDQALAISGLLDDQIGGPSVRPYQPEGFYDNTVVGANYPSTKWIESKGSDIYRRSLYTFWKRTVPHPLMTTFDTPDREVCSVRRSRTNTPIQALAVMNAPIFVESARVLAETILGSDSGSDSARLSQAFQQATGRSPDDKELDTLLVALLEMEASFEAAPEEAEAYLTVGRHSHSSEHEATKLAAYTAVMSLILNLDESLTKG